ncbi:MAG: 50S ribosomal protein L23 [Planctomycetota bacterium]|jgi:large subunit ribosomal protein L23
MQRDHTTVIKRPRLTEKATLLGEEKRYTFEVLRDANKIEIRNAIEKIYGVKVKKVNTMRVRGKRKRVGRSFGRTPSWKKAIIILHEGSDIDLL